MDFEVAITPLAAADADPDLEGKIIAFPLPDMVREIPHTPPPPLAA